jgi:hypothetical protein
LKNPRKERGCISRLQRPHYTICLQWALDRGRAFPYRAVGCWTQIFQMNFTNPGQTSPNTYRCSKQPIGGLTKQMLLLLSSNTSVAVTGEKPTIRQSCARLYPLSHFKMSCHLTLNDLIPDPASKPLYCTSASDVMMLPDPVIMTF